MERELSEEIYNRIYHADEIYENAYRELYKTIEGEYFSGGIDIDFKFVGELEREVYIFSNEFDIELKNYRERYISKMKEMKKNTEKEYKK